MMRFLRPSVFVRRLPLRIPLAAEDIRKKEERQRKTTAQT